MNQWNQVRISLAPLAGRTIDRIHLGYDQPASTGGFRGYVDDIQVAEVYAGFPGLNLAHNRPATGSAACATTETPAKATDGVIAGNSKWCSGAATRFLQVDLGSARQLRRFVVRHAAAGGEYQRWNTRDFTISVSPDGTQWTVAVAVTGNLDGVTTHPVTVTGRWVRLDVLTPTQDGDAAARIYELEAYGF